MFPFRHSSIFRSRWIALIWAGLICWTALDMAASNSDEPKPNESAREDATGEPYTDKDIVALEESLKKL